MTPAPSILLPRLRSLTAAAITVLSLLFLQPEPASAQGPKPDTLDVQDTKQGIRLLSEGKYGEAAQFFLGIPRDLTEAARIDGCSEFRIFWQIILPLAKPALFTVGLFQFMATWNDFLGPLVFLVRQDQFTLALGLQNYQSMFGGTSWHYLMAASTLVVLPVIVLFFLTQRTFIRGISTTGLK